MKETFLIKISSAGVCGTPVFSMGRQFAAIPFVKIL
jgi:hypothetical protein